MKIRRAAPFTVAFLLLAGLPALAGDFSYAPISGDGNTGIYSGLSYTAKADFVGDGTRSVNGVLFSETGPSRTGYLFGGAANDFGGFGNNVGGVTGTMLSDFKHTGDGSGNASLQLTGLIPGTQYVTSWYNAGFGSPGGRVVDITPSDTGTPFRFDENYTGAGNGNVLRYTFTATGTSITYNFDAVSDGDSFHHYAFTNAVRNTSLLATPVITAASGAGPGFSPFTPSNNDLLQTHLLSVSSSGNFAQEGAGGVPILTNGAFAINGGNPADNSPLATGENNASLTFFLDTTVNALGYDVASIASFGGWNDSGRDRQLYAVSVSYVGDSNFVYLGALDYNPAAGSSPSAVRAVFETSLTGVDAVRFDFLNGQENGYAGYGEFDVVGIATVPEPSSLAMVLCACVACVAVRRLRHRSRCTG